MAEEVIMCKCGNNPAEDYHSCPYADEIHDNNDDQYCNCCGDCRDECLMDI